MTESSSLVLVSFCNVTVPDAPLLAVVDADTGDVQVVDVPRVLATSAGVTGLAFSNDRLYLVTQGLRRRDGSTDPRPSLFILEDNMNVEEHYFFEHARDPHSLVVRDGSLWLASTGTDEVAELVLQDGHVTSERAIWRGSDERSDTNHLNGVCGTESGYVISGFGPRADESWASATSGFIKVLDTGEVLLDGLQQPHSVAAVGGQIAYCESRRGVVRLTGGSESAPLGGYTRGLATVGDRLFAGVSRGRLWSRSRDTVENPAEPGERYGRCGLYSLSLDLTEVAEIADFSHLAQEIYDVAPVPPSMRLPLISDGPATRAVASALWVSYERASQGIREQAREIDRLALVVSNREAEVAGMQAAVDGARGDVDSARREARAESDRLGEVVQAHEREVAQLSGEVRGLQTTVEELEAEIERLHTVVSDAGQEAVYAAGTRQRLETEVAELREAAAKTERLRERLALREEELTGARSETERLRSLVDEKGGELARRETELVKVAAEFERLSSLVVEREQDLARNAGIREQLDAELSWLRAQAAEAERLRERVEAERREARLVRAEIERLGTAANAKDAELLAQEAKLSEGAAQLERQANVIAARDEALSQAHREIERLSSELAKFGSGRIDLERLQDELVLAKDQLGKAQVAAQERGEEISAAHIELERTAAANARLAEVVRAKSAEVRRLCGALSPAVEVEPLHSTLAGPPLDGPDPVEDCARPEIANPASADVRNDEAIVRAYLDPEFYLARNPDVAVQGLDPGDHFLEHGTPERRDPHPEFSTAAYLERHPDLPTGENPFAHAVRSGWRPTEYDPQAFRELMIQGTGAGAAILVVPERAGDVEVVDRRCVSFPRPIDRGETRREYGPTTDIAQLEWQRSEGAAFLAVPAERRWWLRRHPDLALHLVRSYEIVAETPGGILYSLSYAPESWVRVLEDLIVRLRLANGREPSIAEWDSGLGLEGALAECVTCVSGDSLRLADKSVDVVIVGESRGSRAEEARRVATHAVAMCRRVDGLTRLEIEELTPPAHLPSVSVLIPTFDAAGHIDTCLRSLHETLPSAFPIEVVVVDDCSSDSTPEVLARWSECEGRIRTLKNAKNIGFLRSSLAGAEAATGDILVFLNNDTIALPGWLPPLVEGLGTLPRAGAVGGKLVYPNGLLQEAGGLIFRDGSGANYGRYQDPDHPLFCYPREVDYCSGALLALERRLFWELGGFDCRYAPAYYEDTDLCFRVREEAGLRVYVQPASAVVHVEGGTSGTDVEAGVKRYQTVNREKFARRWEDALERRPPAPETYDLATWWALAGATRAADESVTA